MKSQNVQCSRNSVWLRVLRAVLLPLCLAAVACGAGSGAVLGNLGFSVACDSGACEWQVLEGAPRFGGTWHPADRGVDLSADGRASLEQRTAFEPPSERDYVFSATVLREPGVTVRFELHWYRAKSSVTDFWSTLPAPEPLRVDPLPVTDEGLLRFRALSSVPDEAGGLALRIVREGGPGRCWVDELAYRSLKAEGATAGAQ